MKTQAKIKERKERTQTKIEIRRPRYIDKGFEEGNENLDKIGGKTDKAELRVDTDEDRKREKEDKQITKT